MRRRQAGGEQEAVLENRWTVEGIPPRTVEPPVSFLKRGLARLDPFLELKVGVESEHGQPGQTHALFLTSGCIDDGLALTVHLIDPKAGGVLHTTAGRGAEQLRLHSFRDFAQIGGRDRKSVV